MRKLMCANFARLWKNRLFWGCAAFTIIFGLYVVIMRYKNAPSDPPDQVFFFYTVVIGLLAAVFCGLFIGTEYSDGTLRNKLIVGHKREAIYLACFITCTCACLILVAINCACVAIIGIPLLGGIQTPPLQFALHILTSLMQAICLSAICTLLGMIIQSKPSAAITIMLVVIALFAAAVAVNDRLNEPEFYDNFVYTGSDGGQLAEKTPNPAYLTGAARRMYQFFLDLLPTGQAIQLSQLDVTNAWRLPLYSLFISISCTIAGLWIFKKKDLK